ncbi:MAG: hypothetical protein Q7T55_23935 [Solirubrobacteraceae bacterium]|nr:hypothetical protein [Solirubrobacteraceae bacterium]
MARPTRFLAFPLVTGVLAVAAASGAAQTASPAPTTPTPGPAATTPTGGAAPTTPTSGPVPINVSGSVSELQAEGSGLRMAVLGDGGKPRIDHLDATGRTTRTDGLIAPGTIGSVDDATLTPDGGVALVALGGENDALTLHVSTLEDGALRTERISPLGRQAITQTPLVVGPGGAAAVGWYEGRSEQRTVLRLAFRAAGAETFGKPVDIGRPVRGIDGMAIALGPDGGGVVFSLPDISDEKRQRPTVVRHISATGRVSRGIPLPVGLRAKGGRDWRTHVRAGFRRDGTLLAAFLAVGIDRAERDRSSSWFVSLGRRATKPSRVQHLVDDGTENAFGGNLAVRVDRTDRATVVVDRAGDKGLGFYDGTARGVHRSSDFDPGRGASTRLGPLPSGRTVAAWIGATRDRQLGFLAAPQTSARAFRQVSLIPGSTAAFREADHLTGVTGLSGGLLATSWATEEDSPAGGGDLLAITPLPRPS